MARFTSQETQGARMDEKEKKKQRIQEVQALLDEFAAHHHSPELAGYVSELWKRVGRKRNYVITGGKKEIWASAVVYVIARLNFLFDKSNPNYLPPDTICGYFGTRKATVGGRATEIEKALKIRMGEEGLCSPRITDALVSVRLPNGLIVTKGMAKRMGYL